MNQLRLEADEAHEQVEELKNKVKTLEQENLSKEQEITSLNHRNQLLEEEVEKLEASVKDAKDAANQSAQHDTQNEALQRRVQLLEEEAEENDKTLRETNEKYRSSNHKQFHALPSIDLANISECTGSAKPTLRPATTSARCRPSRRSATSGRPSTRRWPRSTPSCRRICTTSRSPSATFKRADSGYWCRVSGDVGVGCRLLPFPTVCLFRVVTLRYFPYHAVGDCVPNSTSAVELWCPSFLAN